MTALLGFKNPHLELAKEAIDYVKKTVVYRANFADRNGILQNNTPDTHFGVIDIGLFNSKAGAIGKQVGQIREKIDKSYKAELNSFLASLPKSITKKFTLKLQKQFLFTAVQSYYAEKYSLGNCSELSAGAFMYLFKKSTDCPVEIFRIKDKDFSLYSHAFLVMGRDQKSDLKDYKTWNAVICDPWARRCYPSSDFAKKMCNYEGCDSDHNPKLRKYDPKQHDLSIETVNIFARG